MPRWIWYVIIAITIIFSYYAYKHIKAAKESPLSLSSYINLITGKK